MQNVEMQDIKAYFYMILLDKHFLQLVPRQWGRLVGWLTGM